MYHRPQFLPYHSQSGLGKWTLAEFQHQGQQFQHQNPLLLLRQQQQQQQEVRAFLMRSVKPRIYQNPSPISPFSPIDLLTEMGAAFMGRCQNSIGLGRGSVVPTPTNLSHHHNRVFVPGNSEEDTETETKMMNRYTSWRQFLGDDNDDARDSVSVITDNEWSDTIQNLIATNLKPTPPPWPQQVNTSSPTSSSSSYSLVVASPLPICVKRKADWRRRW